MGEGKKSSKETNYKETKTEPIYIAHLECIKWICLMYLFDIIFIKITSPKYTCLSAAALLFQICRLLISLD